MTAAQLKSIKLSPINPKQARYIKLGIGGNREELCLSDGTVRLGYYDVPHQLGLSGDKDGIRDLYIKINNSDPGAATRHASQVYDFYKCDQDTLWFTFSKGCLWWCFAEPEVIYTGSSTENETEGSRYRKCIGNWCNTDINGNLLRINDLSGNLTKTVGFRGTICAIDDKNLDYLIRKINGQNIAEVDAAQKAKALMLTAVYDLIKLLQPKDFELLVELVFSQSGWRRISEIGSTMKSIDLELEIPVTGEKAIVQIKSGTTQSQLNEYIDQFQAWDAKYKFYVYHSASTPLSAKDSGIKVVGVTQLSEMVLNAGLLDWLIKKVG